MYTHAEASAIRQKFWTSFGRYMSPVPSARDEKVNWVNYNTGIKGIFFKMDADKDSATVMVEIFLKDTMLQHQYFEIFNSFAKQFINVAGEGWNFCKHEQQIKQESRSVIKVELSNVNIFSIDDWPPIISFLKQRMVGLDAFWEAYKPAFELV